jgi:hypothetical protein
VVNCSFWVRNISSNFVPNSCRDGEGLLKGTTKAIGIESGKDYSENLLKDAKEVLKIAKILKAKKVF